MVVFRIAVSGMAGWVFRLAFAASVAAGAYGVYLAWFASLGEPDPGHDRAAGTLVMAVAFGASLAVCFTLLRAPALRHTTRGAWYACTYGLLLTLFLTTMSLSAGL